MDVARTAPVIDETAKKKLEELIAGLTERMNALEKTVRDLVADKERKATFAPQPQAPMPEPVRNMAEDDEDLVVVARPIADSGNYQEARSMAELSEDDTEAVSIEDFFG